MLARMTTPNRLRWPMMATVTTASIVRSAMLMIGSIPPSPSSSVRRSRFLGQKRLDLLMQASLRERMRDDRPGEEEQPKQDQQLERGQAEARLQHHAEDQQPGSGRIGHAGRMHPGEDV